MRHLICKSLIKILQTCILVNYVLKFLLIKHNKTKGRIITCSYIWHVTANSVNVCWRYTLPNSNSIVFCDSFSDIGHCFRPARKSVGIQKSIHIRIILNKICYFLGNIEDLISLSWCRLRTRRQRQTPDKIPKLPTDRQCLYNTFLSL